MDIIRPDHDVQRSPQPRFGFRIQRTAHGGCAGEDAMDERDDTDRRDETEATQDHAARCGCPECDPDFYLDRDEIGDERHAA